MATQMRMFMPAADISRRLQGIPRRSTASSTLFGHLTTPGGGRTYPITYVDALLRTSGPLNDRVVRRFNASADARSAMEAARVQFERRLEERKLAGPQPGLLSLADVAWLLGVSRSAIDNPRRAGKFPTTMHDGQHFVDTEEVLKLCKWHLPLR